MNEKMGLNANNKRQELKLAWHHLWSRTLLAFAFVTMMLAIGLVLLRASTPILDRYQTQIQSWLTKQLKYPVKFTQLAAGWSGFEPVIKIENLTIENPKNQPLITIDNFAIGFNLLETLVHRKLNIGLIICDGATLRIVAEQNGTTTIYGNTNIPIASLQTNQQGNGLLIQELLSINTIRLNNLKVLWEKSNYQQIGFRNVAVEMNSDGNHHHAWGVANILFPEKGKLAFVTKFKGNLINKASVSGTMYIHGRNLKLRQWLPAVRYKNILLDDGIFSGKTWGIIKNGQVNKVQGEICASHIKLINVQTKDDQIINKLSGDIEWKTHKKGGWMLAVDNLNTNSQINTTTNQSFYFNYHPSTQTQSQSITAFLNSTSIPNVASLATFFHYASLSSIVTKYQLLGAFTDIYLHYVDNTNFALRGSFNKLALQVPNKNLGVENLAGTLYLFPTMGELNFQTKNLTVNANQLPIKSITMNNYFVNTVDWYYNNTNLVLQAPNVQIANPDFIIHASLNNATIPIGDPKTAQLKLILQASNINLAAVKNYLPPQNLAHARLLDFIRQAFTEGNATVTMQLNGPLNQFPFNNTAVNNNENFSSDIILSNADLFYKNGWPKLKNLTAEVQFRNQKMIGQIQSATSDDLSIADITAEIPDIADHMHPNINIKGDVNTTLEQGWNFVTNSPLQKTLGARLKILNLQGPINLQLNMDIPLKPEDHNNKIIGKISTANATVSLPDWGLTFQQVRGTLSFINNAIYATSLQGEFLNYPIIANINTLNPATENSTTDINLSGQLDTSKIQDVAPNEFTKKISGITNYKACLKLFSKPATANLLTISSDLQGVAINLPEPFDKINTAIMPTAALISFSTNQPTTIKANAGKNLNFQAQFQKNQSGTTFLNGNLHLGSAAAKPQRLPGLLIDGNLNYFNWEKWKPLLENHAENKTNIANKIRLINLDIAKFNFYDYLFLSTNVQAVYKNPGWNLTVNGPSIAGTLQLPNSNSNTLIANLSRLTLNSPKQSKTNKKAANYKVLSSSLPALTLNIANFNYNNTQFGKVKFVSQPTQTGLTVSQLQINTPTYELNAAGFWNVNNTSISSGLQGSVDAANTQDLLSSFHYANKINAQNVQIKFNLQWPDNIFTPSLKTASGTIDLQTGAGSIIGMGASADNEIAAGQLLTILSIQSLQRRLTMNFNDLTTKGFSFDKISGDFKLNNGVANTSNGLINGIIASIDLNGQINMVKRTFDLFVQVTPKITSSIPVIAAIAGGPVIGAATWVVNKLVSPSLNQIASKYFHLGGTWSNPTITPISSFPSQTKTKLSFI